MNEEVELCLSNLKRIVEKACPEILFKGYRYYPLETHPLFNLQGDEGYRGFLQIKCQRVLCEKRGDVYTNVTLNESYHIRVYDDSLSYNRLEERLIVDGMIASILEMRAAKERYRKEIKEELREFSWPRGVEHVHSQPQALPSFQ